MSIKRLIESATGYWLYKTRYLPVGAVAPAARDEVDLVLTARVGQCLDMAPHDELPLDDKFEE